MTTAPQQVNSAVGTASPRCLFIGGCSRSGTTLLGGLLGGSPHCLVTPESQFKVRLAASVARGELTGPGAIKRALLADFRFRLWGITSELAAVPPGSPGLPGLVELPALIRQALELYAASQDRSAWNTWVDHTPENIKYIPLLSELFPGSVFVHLVRDGRGVYSSVKPLDWGPNGPVKGAQWWTRGLVPGLAAELAFPARVIRVHFEDLLADPGGELRRVCAFAGLDFSETMLKGDGFTLPAYTRRQHALVGQPPRASVAVKWQNSLSAREVEIFESLAGAQLAYLGYGPSYGLRARPPGRWERYREFLFGRLWRKLINRCRLARRRRNA